MKIEIRDLNKSFGDLKVLDGVNLTIEPGEICVILGRSGQGKTVILKHLVGLMKPDSGSILIDGEDITKLDEEELYPFRMRFGMIFQNAGLLQSLSVEQNIGLPLMELRGAHKKDTLEKVKEKLRMVDLKEEVAKQDVATLSGGQRKRVAIARALMQDADCMLFDEPTAGLDPIISKTVDDLILRVNKETNATMIVVTHDLVSAFYVADKIHLLNNGQVIFSGTPEEFKTTDNEIAEAFRNRVIGEPKKKKTSSPDDTQPILKKK